MTYDITAVADLILRRSRLSQRDIADRSGIHYTTINRWLRRRSAPNTKELDTVLSSLGYGVRVVNLTTGRVVEGETSL
jgi:transcriptional regulator with XRE-family HTH domain